MSSDERELAELVDRDLPWPTHMEFVAARDRVLDQLRATPEHRLALASRDVPTRPRVSHAANSRISTRPWALAMAVAVVIAAVGGAIVWPRGGVRVYAAGNDGLQVTLADDSRVEMRAHAEMTVGRASDGIQIDLKNGDIIVSAAKERDGHLYVRTKDMTVALSAGAHHAKVDGDDTVFLVNARQDGSRVGVIEGEVRVREGNRETRLRPGEQVASSAIVARPLTEGITWSRNAGAHLTILESFMKGMALTAGPLRPLASADQATGGQAGTVAGTAARAEFEEASIRECDPDNVPPPPARARGGGANSFQMTPGRLYALCLTPATLVRTALGYTPANINPGGGPARGMNFNNVYGLGVEDGLRVRGGPNWVRNEYYTIEAVAAAPADAETQRGPMLLALLERRFGLKYHIETEQIPAFALTVAPGGVKMKKGTCVPPNPPPSPGARGSTVDGVRRNVDAARRGATTIGPCGFSGAVNGRNLIFVGAGAGVPPLGGFLGVPVIDRTGIPASTRFNYVLEFTPDETTPGQLSRIPDLPGLQIATDPSAVPPAASLRTVLEEQFGLRLEPAQAPREFIVIDAIERPGPN